MRSESFRLPQEVFSGGGGAAAGLAAGGGAGAAAGLLAAACVELPHFGVCRGRADAREHTEK